MSAEKSFALQKWPQQEHVEPFAGLAEPAVEGERALLPVERREPPWLHWELLLL